MMSNVQCGRMAIFRSPSTKTIGLSHFHVRLHLSDPSNHRLNLPLNCLPCPDRVQAFQHGFPATVHPSKPVKAQQLRLGDLDHLLDKGDLDDFADDNNAAATD